VETARLDVIWRQGVAACRPLDQTGGRAPPHGHPIQLPPIQFRPTTGDPRPSLTSLLFSSSRHPTRPLRLKAWTKEEYDVATTLKV